MMVVVLGCWWRHMNQRRRLPIAAPSVTLCCEQACTPCHACVLLEGQERSSENNP